MDSTTISVAAMAALRRWAQDKPLNPGMHRDIRDAGLGIIDHQHCLILNDAGRQVLYALRGWPMPAQA